MSIDIRSTSSLHAKRKLCWTDAKDSVEHLDKKFMTAFGNSLKPLQSGKPNMSWILGSPIQNRLYYVSKTSITDGHCYAMGYYGEGGSRICSYASGLWTSCCRPDTGSTLCWWHLNTQSRHSATFVLCLVVKCILSKQTQWKILMRKTSLLDN